MSLSTWERMGTGEGGRECELPESWFSFFSFLSFFFLFITLSFARGNFPERVRGIRNVSCVYHCGYFSVINECYRDMFSLIAVTVQGNFSETVCCETLEERERREEERERIIVDF